MSDPLPTPFKVFGLQRTGTNLAVALVLKNFHAHSLEIGSEWKHGPAGDPGRRWNGVPWRFVLCVKNPYAWLWSCYRYFSSSRDADPTVAPQFRARARTTFDEFVSIPSYEFRTPVERWNEMYRRWMRELPPERTAVIRHEDQLAGQVRVLEAVERRLDLRRKASALAGFDRRVDVDCAVLDPMDCSFYTEGRYFDAFSLRLMELVNDALDPGVMSCFGYRAVPSAADAGDAWAKEWTPPPGPRD